MPFKQISEYEPEQQGIVAQAYLRRGNRFLRDGGVTGDECPHCCVLLRVSRQRRGPITLRCPCGYERLLK